VYLLPNSNIIKMARYTTKEENQKFKKKVAVFKGIANTFMAGIATGAITLGVLQGINNPSVLEQRVLASETAIQEQASEKESAEIKEVSGVNYVAKEKATLGYKKYIVKKGDSYWSIAKNIDGVSSIDLIKYNKISPKALRPGMVLKIPESEKNPYPKSNPRNISEKGINLIKMFEGFRTEPYFDVNQWAIGYGHRIENKNHNRITSEEAEKYLKGHLEYFEEVLENNVKVKLSSNQYDALVSFIYNVNPVNFKKSTLLKKLNKGDYLGAAEEFKRWNKANGKVLPGLTRRRLAEYKLFKGEN